MHTKYSATSALIVLLSFASIFAVLVALFPAGFERGLSFLFVLIFSRQSGLMMLGIALLLLVVSVQWWQILNLKRINNVPLSEVERLHPKLPASLEIIMTGLLSTALIIFFVQLISIAHSVLLTVTLASRVAETNEPRDLIISDFDADGDLDYITGNLKTASENHNVYRNSGTGAYTRVQQIDASTNFIAFDGGDLDGDGDTDFVQVTNTAASVYLGSGTGSFNTGPAVSMDSYSAPNTFTDIALGDVDSDGDLDAVTTGKGTMSGKSLFLNNGKGALTQTKMGLGSSSAVTLLDVNADDYLDIAAVSTIGRLTVYRNLGTGAFLQVFSAANVTLLPVLAHGDIDGDGDIDILSANTSQQVVAWKAGGTGSFTALTGVASLVSTVKGIALGDIDNDGDLDIIVAGITDGEFNGGAQLLYNDGNGVFSNPGITMVSGLDNTRAVAIGDIDSDSDLDWILANSAPTKNGHYKTNQSTIVANAPPNAPGSLSASIISPSAITGATIADTAGTGSVAWINASNGGRSDDVYATAALASGERAKYLQATGYNFEIPSSATVQGIVVTIERKASTGSLFDGAVRVVKAGSVVGTNQPSATAWATTDSFVSYGSSTDVWGTTWTPAEINSGAFGAALSAVNSSDEAVTASVDNITITVYTNLYDVRLTWGSGSDSQTATRGLQYQPRVGTGSATDNILPSRIVGSEYTYRTMSNGKSRTYFLKNLACGLTYYWTVRTRDVELAPSSASTESSFELDASCNLYEAPAAQAPQGGTIWGGLFRHKKEIVKFKVLDSDSQRIPENGTVKMRTFVDFNKNGLQENRGERSISDLTAYLEGVTADGTKLSQELPLGKQGEVTISIAPSGPDGYTFTLQESDALGDYEPTQSDHTVFVEAGSEYAVNFGFAPMFLGEYAPCWELRRDVVDKKERSDAVAFLEQMESIYGEKVLEGIDTKSPIVTRKTFFTLLQRMLCKPLLQNVTAIRATKLSPFDDMPMDAFPENQVVYSLRALGIPIAISSGDKNVVNLKAYISREDAMLALSAALSLTEEDPIADSGELPVDVKGNTPLAEAVQKLAARGLLSKAYWPLLNPKGGLTLQEAALLLARSMFAAGTMSLAPEEVPEGSEQSYPTFLAPLSFSLKQSECLKEDTGRRLLRTDVRPGDPLYDELSDLAKYGVPNSEGKMLWLDTGVTNGTVQEGFPSAAGVQADLDAPLTALEAMRSFLVLTCTPWLTKEEMANGGYTPQQGGANWFAVDHVFDLAFSTDLDFRLAAASQHDNAYGLRSLINPYASTLRNAGLRPQSILTVQQLAAFAASAILNIALDQGVLTPPEAGTYVEETEFAVLQFLSADAGVPLARTREIAATRGQLVSILSTIVGLRRETSATELQKIRPSAAEVWDDILNSAR